MYTYIALPGGNKPVNRVYYINVIFQMENVHLELIELIGPCFKIKLLRIYAKKRAIKI